MSTTLHLDLAADSPDLLLRVIAACHRRNVLIVSMRYHGGTPGSAAGLMVTLDGASDRCGHLEYWLGNLVGVTGVRALEGSPDGQRCTEAEVAIDSSIHLAGGGIRHGEQGESEG